MAISLSWVGAGPQAPSCLGRLFMQRQVAEAQGVGHDENRAEGHSQGGDHGGELQPEGYEEDTRGDGDADDVINEGPEEVLLDHPQGGPREVDGRANRLEARGHKDNVGGLDGYICAGPNRDTTICSGQGGGIVDAVAYHSNFFSV